MIASHGSQSARVSKVATKLGAWRNTFAGGPRITPSVLWSPGPRRYVQAPLPVGDRGSGSDDAQDGAKRRIAREPPGKRTNARRAWVEICEKKTTKKLFSARDTAALLLDCAIAHSIELALIASHGSQSVRVSKVATMLGAERIPVARYPRSTPSCAMVTRASPACPSTATSWG